MSEEVVNVKVKVKAIAQGYYGNRIVNEGEVFTYEGGLNARGGLPLWVEAMEKWSASKEKIEKKDAPKKGKEEKDAPKKSKEVKAEVETNALPDLKSLI